MFIVKILVTGGAGFIGSNLIDKLLEQGNSIFCLDNFDNFYETSIKRKNIELNLNNDNFTLIEGDIRDKVLLQKIFNENKIDIVIHFAAKAGVRSSIMNPQDYYDVNVMGTLYLLEVMQAENVKRLIFASSSSVYGNNKKVPFSENDNVDYPISPYAATKKTGELMCHTYHKLYNFDIFCLRFFSVYGPRQRPDMAIHNFGRNILNGTPINVFGNGTSKRDYTYIDDIVEGSISAINNLKGYKIINLGESKTYNLNAVIELLEEALHKKAIINRLPEQLGDVYITNADISKAKKILQYSPKIKLEEGIQKFAKWLLNKNHENPSLK